MTVDVMMMAMMEECRQRIFQSFMRKHCDFMLINKLWEHFGEKQLNGCIGMLSNILQFRVKYRGSVKIELRLRVSYGILWDQ